MKELLDQPITGSDEDRLGFRHVAKSLLIAIEAQPNYSSLTLGLDGPWGSGKSSILAMMLADVESKNQTEGIGTVVVTFSPWLVGDQEALIASLFDQLMSALKEAEKQAPRSFKKTRKAIGKILKKTKYLLNRFSAASTSLAEAASTLETFGFLKIISYPFRVIQAWTKEVPVNATLEEVKRNLEKELAELAKLDSTFRIVILVDDLDRLEPKDALEVLRLVKAVADFPAVTYVLAYDRDALARAIAKRTGIKNGDTYLEKIIQFSFRVPPLEPFQLRHWLRAELEALAPGQINMSSKRTAVILDTWAGRLLHNPRDVKRLLFAVRAIWSKLKNRVDLLDLVWLQMISLKASDDKKNLYSWLVRYLQALDAIAIGGNVSGEQEDRSELEKILKKLGWKGYVRDEHGMRMDFHHLDELLAGVKSSYLGELENNWTHDVNEQELQEFRSKKRLSSPWHWRLYFAFDEPTHAITDAEWNVLAEASKNSTEALIQAIEKIFDVRGSERKDAADQVLEKVQFEAESKSLPKSERWLVAIIRSHRIMQERSKRDRLFGMTRLLDYKLVKLTRVIAEGTAGKARKNLLNEIFNNNDHIGVAAALLRDQLFANEKPEHEKEERLFLTEAELENVKSQQLAIYGGLTWQQLIGTSSPYDVLYSWNKAAGDNEGAGKLLMSAFEDNNSLVEALEALKCYNNSEQNGVPHVVEAMLKTFVDAKWVKERLGQVAKGDDEIASRAKALLNLWWEDGEF